MFIYFMAIWNILRAFGILFDRLVHFVFIWDIYSGFVIVYQEKSGSPALAGFEATFNLLILRMGCS
jgi:hypothetical protein